MEEISPKKRLLNNIVSLYLLQGLNYIIPMAVLPYLIRTLGIQVYGLVAFSQAFAQYFVILTDYGFNLSATRFIARNRDDKGQLQSIFWQVLLLKSALMVAGFLGLVSLVTMVPRFNENALIYMLAYLAVAGNVLFPQWYFQGMEQMRSVSAVTGTMKLFSSALLFLFVHSPQDGLKAVLIQSLGVFFAGLVGFILGAKAVGLGARRPRLRELRETLVDGWSLFVSTAAISLYTNTNLVLVGLIAGNIEAGYFSAAEKLIRAISGLVGPVTQALFPHINALATRSRDAALKAIALTARWMGFLSLLASSLLWIAARPIAQVCFGPAVFEGSIPVIRWVAFLPFLISVSNVLGIQTMLTFGLDKQFSRILLVSGVINLLLATPLVYLFGARGAGTAVLLTEFTVTLSMFILLRAHKINIINPESVQV